MYRLSNQQCNTNNLNIYKQCNVLTEGRVIPSCSNTYGIDSLPPSVPQQSNFHFMDGRLFIFIYNFPNNILLLFGHFYFVR